MIRHHANRDLFNYWNRLRADTPAPEQRLMDPALIGEALPDIFIIDVTDDGTYEIRLAGTRLCAFWGRELRGTDALSLWDGQDREGAEMLFFSIVEDAAVAVASHQMTNSKGRTIEMEMVAMPLTRRVGRKTVRRIIGAFVPWSTPFWMGMEPIVHQAIASVRMVWPENAPALVGREPFADIEAHLEAHLEAAAEGVVALHPAVFAGPVAAWPAPPVRAPDEIALGHAELGEEAINGMLVLQQRGHLRLLRGGGDREGGAGSD